MALPTLSRKLTVLLAAATALALGLGGLGSTAMEYFAIRRSIVQELQAQAAVVGYSASMAMAFQDKLGSGVELANLKASRRVVRGALYTPQGQVYAVYPATEAPGGFPAIPASRKATVRIAGGFVDVFAPNDVGDGTTSFIYLQGRTDEIWPRVMATLKVQALILGVVFGVVLLFSLGLQRTLSEPLQSLVDSVKRVGAQQDYDVRVRPAGGCQELLDLGEGFNAMIATVQDRDARLLSHQEHLEEQVEARTQELTRAAAELLAAKNRAEEASRAKSDFLANMSHELRTPLNAVLLYSELLRQDLEDQGLERLTPDLRTIHGAGKHLLALIEGILDLAGIEAGRTSPGAEWVDLHAVLDAALPPLMPLMESQGNQVLVELPEDLPHIRTDRKKVATILFHLLENSGKFTRDGTITCRARQDGAFVKMAIQDTGIGMRPDQVARLFQGFTQGEAYSTRRVGGLGLGLTLSQRLATLLGGRIEVESEEGQGSVFTLVLPVACPTRSRLLAFTPCYPPEAPVPLPDAEGSAVPGWWVSWSAPPKEPPVPARPDPTLVG